MKKFKDIKTNPEPAKGKNVDPSQLGQYSAKYQVSEGSASLNQYLSSRGINPKFVSTATKIAHSKSSQFIKWQQDHMRNLKKEETVNEISMDNISPMMQAHVKKGRVGSLNVGTRMASSKPTVRAKPKPKKVGLFQRLFAGEEVQLEASKPSALDRFRAAAATREVKHNNTEKERQERLHKEPSASNLPHRDVKSDGMSDAISRLEKHMNKEEVSQEKINAFHAKLDTLVHKTFGKRRAEMKMKEEIELEKEAHLPGHPMYQSDPSLYKKTSKSITKKFATHSAKYFSNTDSGNYKPTDKEAPRYRNEEVVNEVLGKDASAGDWIHDFVHSDNPRFAGKSKAERKKMALGAYYGKQNEDMWQDPQAATQTPADGANGGNQVADRKRQMSKSARMIKALYKRKGVVKEDMYDHEKEDKSVATYGKKPKMSQKDKNDSLGENKPQAAATLSGGTTLTGVKRDSIEIDPIMRNRPGNRPDQPDISKKSGKKEDNKNDK
jgi:hypothetical protein